MKKEEYSVLTCFSPWKLVSYYWPSCFTQNEQRKQVSSYLSGRGEICNYHSFMEVFIIGRTRRFSLVAYAMLLIKIIRVFIK